MILVIGLLTAIAVPQFGRFDEAADAAKNQNNARSAASICAAAKVAGHDFIANALHPESEHWVLQGIVAGATVEDPGGPFDGNYFALPGLELDEIYGAQKYLDVINDILIYIPEGDSVDPVDPGP